MPFLTPQQMSETSQWRQLVIYLLDDGKSADFIVDELTQRGVSSGIARMLIVDIEADRRSPLINGQPGTSKVDYYEILQVSPNADTDVVRAAYEHLISKFQSEGSLLTSAGTANRVKEAFGILSDPQSREIYDRHRMATTTSPGATTATSQPEKVKLAEMKRLPSSFGPTPVDPDLKPLVFLGASGLAIGHFFPQVPFWLVLLVSFIGATIGVAVTMTEALAKFEHSVATGQRPGWTIGLLGKWCLVPLLWTAALALPIALHYRGMEPILEIEDAVDRARVYADEGRLDEALQEMNKAVRILELRLLISMPSAQERFRAAGLIEEFALVYHERGRIYSRRGDWNRAIDSFSQAIKLDRNCFQAFAGRALVYHELGDVARCDADAEEARRLQSLRKK